MEDPTYHSTHGCIGREIARARRCAKGVTGQKMRRQQIEISSSDSEEIPHANQMEVEPAEPAARAAASPTATEELSGTHLTGQPQGGSAAPSLPTVLEGAGKGGHAIFLAAE